MYSTLVYFLLKFPFTKGLFELEDLAKWRAVIYLTFLEILLFISFQGIYALKNEHYKVPTDVINIRTVLLIVVIQYFNSLLIGDKSNQKKAIAKYNSFSTKERVFYMFCVVSVVVLILSIFVYVMYSTGKKSGKIV